MDPNNPSNEPGSGPGYVPYFYQSGRYRLYAVASEPIKTPAFDAPTRDNQFPPHRYPIHTPDGPQTVEQIIRQGYLAVPQADPIAAILTDKQHTSWLGLDDLIQQSRGRAQIYQQNAYEIEQAKCEAWNSLFRIEASQGRPANDQHHYVVDKRLQELYAEQRTERQSLWRDLSRIRLNVPESAQQYLSAYRTIAAMNTVPGELE